MIAAPTLAEALHRAEVYGRPHPLRDRLVSVVFAHPTTPSSSRVPLNARGERHAHSARHYTESSEGCHIGRQVCVPPG